MRYVALAGNIGSGKSTLAARLASGLCIPLIGEPVEDNPFLERFYEDPRAWAFHLQMFNLGNRAASILTAAEGGNFVLDRSFEEDIVFVQEASAAGFDSSEELAIYESLYEVIRLGLPAPNLLVYLDAPDVRILLERIVARDRGFESGVSLEYLERLNQRYRLWFEQYSGEKLRLSVEGLDLGQLESAVLSRLREM